ncbi:MAG: hypothetical protein IPJ33_13890 [Gammaproteobacteria bacterium]|nr:hypothetical protein [Gammaproteobacteria bacterium]MBK7729537.1 hypothetical protein [Gammaproteobacteria bacterium]MBP6052712.1 hypothetical protein [Pseudomonadales bacterium]MBP6229809.1 hypothetical protein [Pseudomonadales bacterium]
MLEAIRRKFNEGWYAARYKTFLKDFDGTPFDYYMAQGWRLGHDPHADFSELFYRAEYDDVAQALQDGAYSSGFHHYLQHGIAEGRLAVPKAPLGRQFYEQAYFHIDCAYLEAQHRIDPARYLSTYDFYFIESRRTDIDPNPLFSERGYLYFHPDVVEARKNRDPIVGCGFAHFLTTGLAEGRRICSVSEFARLAARQAVEANKQALEKNLPQITHPVEIEYIKHIRGYIDRFDLETREESGHGFTVIVPDFLPEILFGGYHCLFRILEVLKHEHGLRLRLVVMKQINPADAYANVHRMRLQYPGVHELFESIEHVPNDRHLVVSAGWDVLSYACHTHYLAAQIGALSGRLPYFLIQDDESEFHGAGSLRSFIRSAWDIPHIGIYNSAILVAHFRAMRPQQFGEGYRWCSFENEIKPLTDSQAEFIARHAHKRRRTIVIYARPEAHAARNEFAIIMLSLHKLIEDGELDRDKWRILGVGSLHYCEAYEIVPGYSVDIRPKMPVDDYENLLKESDVGISLISTPHPGIIHFQMASFGLSTVTNTSAIRTAASLRAQSANIVPSALSLAQMPGRILQAMRDSADLEARFANAQAQHTVDYAQEIAKVADFLAHH